MVTAEQFIAQIDSYLERAKVSPSAFGREAVGDPNLVSDLKSGRMPNLRTVERITEFMSAPRASSDRETAA